MNRLDRADEVMVRVLRAIALVGFTVLIGEAIVVTIDAFLRSFLNAPIRGLSEVVEITTATAISTCVPVVVALRRNIRVNLLSGVLGSKARALVDLLANVLLLIFLAVVALQLAKYASDVLSMGERSLIRRIPLAPFWIVAAAIVALSVPAQLLITLVSLQRLQPGRRGETPVV